MWVNEDIVRIHLLYETHRSVFGSHCEKSVLAICERVRQVFSSLFLDYYHISALVGDACLSYYGQKENRRFFLNLFFAGETVDGLLIFSTADDTRTEKGSLGELLSKLVALWDEGRDGIS